MNTILLKEDDMISKMDFSKLKIGSQFIEVKKSIPYDTHVSVMLTDIYRECLYVFKTLKISYTPMRQTLSDTIMNTYLRIDEHILNVHNDKFESINRDDFFIALSGTIDDSINSGKLLGKILTADNIHVWFCAIPFKTIPDKYLIILTRIALDFPHINISHHFAILDPNHHFSITFAVDNYDEIFNFINDKLLSSEYNKYNEKLLNPLKYSIDDYFNGISPDSFKSLFKIGEIDKCFLPIFEHNNFKIYNDYTKRKIICTYNDVMVETMSNDYLRIVNQLKDFYYNNDIEVNPFTGVYLNKSVMPEFKDAGGIYIDLNNSSLYYTYLHGIYVESTEEEKKDIMDRYNIVNALTE